MAANLDQNVKTGMINLVYAESMKRFLWHGQGTQLTEEETKSLLLLMQKPELNWIVEHTPILLPEGELGNPDEKRVVRVYPDGTREHLAVVGPNTHILQNADCWEFFQPAIDSGFATISTAGALDGGKKLFMQAEISDSEERIGADDTVRNFISFFHSHNNSWSVTCGRASIAVVCMNTARAALNSKASALVRIKHGKDVKKRVSELRDVITATKEEAKADADKFRFLRSKSPTVAQLERYVKRVFGVDPDASKDEISTRKINQVEGILANILAGHEERQKMGEMLLQKQKEFEAQQKQAESNLLENILSAMDSGTGHKEHSDNGTSYWSAFNGVTNYLTHTAGHNPETRFMSTNFGQNAKTIDNAIEIGLAMADGSMV